MKPYRIFYKSIDLENKNIKIKEQDNRYYVSHNHQQTPLDNLIVNDLYHIDNIKNKGKLDIYINFNITQLNKKLQNPILFSTKKNFIDTCKLCKNYIINNYIYNFINNIFDDILNDNNINVRKYIYNQINKLNHVNHKKNIEWFVYKECKQSTYYYYNKDVFKIGKFHINTSNGNFNDINSLNSIKMQGGILINNNDYEWINDYINLHNLRYNISNILPRKDYFKTKDRSSLVICDYNMCSIWQNKLKLINDKLKYLIIKCHNDTKDISYNDMETYDIVIVSNKYIVHNKYKKLHSNYKIFNTNISTIYNVMRNEYYNNFNNTKSYKHPILSHFHWNRVIIDISTINKMFSNNYLKDILSTIYANIRWVQIDKLPNNNISILKLINYVANTEITSPLLNKNNKQVYEDNIIRFNDKNTLKDKISNVTEDFKIIKMYRHEKVIYDFCIENSIDKNNNKFNILLFDCINKIGLKSYNIKNIKIQLLKNFNKTKTNLEKKLNKSTVIGKLKINSDIMKLTTKINNINNINIDNRCNICYESHIKNDVIVTQCTHNMCIKCLFNILQRSSCCPFCREQINLSNIYRISKNICNTSKLNNINRLIKYNKTLIVCRDNTNIHNIYNNIKHDNIVKYIGSNNKKIEKIETFNNSNKGILILLIEQFLLIQCLHSYNHIIFYDYPYLDDSIDRKLLYNLYKNTLITYMVYDNTIECKNIKNILNT